MAALGVGMRVTAFTSVPIYALSAALVPFVGQNWGAKEYARARKARWHSNEFGIIWGFVCCAILWICAPWIAPLFRKEAEIQASIILFLRIVPLGFALQNMFILTVSVLNAIHKPVVSTALMTIRMFVLYIPLGWVLSRYWGSGGLFAGMAAGNAIAGTLALITSAHLLKRMQRHEVSKEPGYKPPMESPPEE